jgi:hypothetical protein
MDRIPPHKIDRTKSVEDAARLKDVSDKVKAARPLDGSGEIIQGSVRDGPKYRDPWIV